MPLAKKIRILIICGPLIGTKRPLHFYKLSVNHNALRYTKHKKAMECSWAVSFVNVSSETIRKLIITGTLRNKKLDCHFDNKLISWLSQGYIIFVYTYIRLKRQLQQLEEERDKLRYEYDRYGYMTH